MTVAAPEVPNLDAQALLSLEPGAWPGVEKAARPLTVLFIWTDITTADNRLLNLGLMSIAGALKAAGHRSKLAYYKRMPEREDFLGEVDAHEPDVIAFSVYTNQWWYVRQLASWLQEHREYPVVAGGIHATLDAPQVAESGAFDAVCMGEGEFAFLEYLQCLARGEEPDAIPNFWLKKRDGSWQTTPMRPRVEPLDLVPPQSVDLFDVDAYLKSVAGEMLWVNGRGCPYTCHYCAVPTLNDLYREVGRGGVIRRFQPERAVAEMEACILRYPGIRRFLFHDEILTLDTRWLAAWGKLYRERVGLPFGFQARIETMTRERLTLLRQAGGDLIKIGLESGSEWLRKQVLNRRMSNDAIDRGFTLARELGFHTLAYVMVGFPEETPAMVEETVALLERVRPDDVMAFIFYPYPGTPLYERCKEQGLLGEDWAADTWEKSVLRLTTMTPQQVKDGFHRITRTGLRLNVERNPHGDYDFLARFSTEARVTCTHPDGVRIDHFSATYPGGAFLYAPPRSRIEYPAVPVPEGGTHLVADLAVHPESIKRPIAPMRYLVEIDGQVALEYRLDPHRRRADQEIHRVSVPITRNGAPTRRIALITESDLQPGQEAPWGGWGHVHLNATGRQLQAPVGRPIQLILPDNAALAPDSERYALQPGRTLPSRDAKPDRAGSEVLRDIEKTRDAKPDRAGSEVLRDIEKTRDAKPSLADAEVRRDTLGPDTKPAQPLLSRDSDPALRESLRTGAVPPGPRYVNLLPTSICNAACDFCPQFSQRFSPDGDKTGAPQAWYQTGVLMSRAMFERLIDDLRALGGVDELLVLGGEPLLHRQLPAFIAHAKDQLPKASVSLFTNGVLLEKCAPALVEAGVDVLTVSLNAVNAEDAFAVNRYRETDDWQRAIDGIEAFNRARGASHAHVRLSFVLTRRMAGQAQAAYALARRFGAQVLSFLPLWPVSRDGQGVLDDLALGTAALASFNRDIEALRSIASGAGITIETPGSVSAEGLLDTRVFAKENSCLMGHVSATVLADGTVTPCCSSLLPLGNLNEERFAEIWAGARYRNFRQQALSLPDHGAIEKSWCHQCQDADLNMALARKIGVGNRESMRR